MIGIAISSIQTYLNNIERCYLEERDNPANIVILDSIDNESWGMSSRVSNQTIEKGKYVSDHVHMGPETVSFTAIITNHTGISVADPTSLSRLQGLDVTDIITERLQQLTDWLKEQTILNYYGAVYESFEGCVLTSVKPSKTSATGEAINLSIGLQKVKIPEAEGFFGIEPPGALKNVAKKGLVVAQIVNAVVSQKNYTLTTGVDLSGSGLF